MRIINGVKKDDTSVLVDRKILEDSRLDYRTRGLLITIIGLNKGSDIEVADLLKFVQVDREESMLNDTKSAVRTSLEILEDFGYLVKISGTGRLDYAVNQNPVRE